MKCTNGRLRRPSASLTVTWLPTRGLNEQGAPFKKSFKSEQIQAVLAATGKLTRPELYLHPVGGDALVLGMRQARFKAREHLPSDFITASPDSRGGAIAATKLNG